MRGGSFVLVSGLLAAACATAPPPPPPPPAPPPPPPPLAELEPPHAVYFNYPLPKRDETGAFITPNSDLGPMEQLFHFRSALNVAALSCRFIEGYDLAPAYNQFIKTYAKELGAANRAIDDRYKRENGREGARMRDTHMTAVYNHFARPATLGTFCPIARRSLEGLASVEEGGLDAYAQPALLEMEQVFQDHYRQIETYQLSYRERMRERGMEAPPMPLAIGEVPPAPVMVDGVPAETVDPAVAATAAGSAATPEPGADTPQPSANQ